MVPSPSNYYHATDGKRSRSKALFSALRGSPLILLNRDIELIATTRLMWIKVCSASPRHPSVALLKLR